MFLCNGLKLCAEASQQTVGTPLRVLQPDCLPKFSEMECYPDPDGDGLVVVAEAECAWVSVSRVAQLRRAGVQPITPFALKRGILVTTDAPHNNSLLIENVNLRELLAICIRTFDSRGHRLTAVRDDGAPGGLVRPTSFLSFVGKGVRIDLLY